MAAILPRRMNMHIQLDAQCREDLFGIIQRSCGITGYEDLLHWLRDDVSRLLPHDVLVAAWGDFPRCRLRYDIASSLAGVRSAALLERALNLDVLMRSLHRRWLDEGGRWCTLQDIDEPVPTWPGAVSSPKWLRGGHDCLYAFFARGRIAPVVHQMPGMLLPHLDWVLRRIGGLPAAKDCERLAGWHRPFVGMSGREREIMHWVRHGKTNPEISAILNISPNTVKSHLKRIFYKMQVSTRAQAVAHYVEGHPGHGEKMAGTERSAAGRRDGSNLLSAPG